MRYLVLSCLRWLLPAMIALLGASASAVTAQPATLDSTWASSGKAITPVGTGFDNANAIAVQSDGKVVLAGSCEIGIAVVFCAARYQTDGTLDTSFGNGGTVVTAIGAGSAFASAMAIQPDGKIVLGGYCDGVSDRDFCALRYLSNGLPDTSFGIAGVTITPVGLGTDRANAMLLQPDGKIVLVGSCANGLVFSFCGLRYLGNGAVDTAFGNAGTFISSLSSSSDYANAVALQTDGKIVVAGECANDTEYAFCVIRYEINGAVDLGFGASGFTITQVASGSDYASTVAVQPDGKVILGGSCDSADRDFCAVRYLANGALDTTFGTGGKVVSTVGSSFDFVNTIALQPDGKTILAGSCASGFNYAFCGLRYHSNGVLDTSFGSNGTFLTQIGSSSDNASAIALQPDGKFILGGECSNGTNDDFCVARFDNGPFGYKYCTMDIDGDGRVLATVDSLIHARIALGITGNAVVSGVPFPANAKRNSWSLIREYLVTQCEMSLPQ